MKGSPLMTLGLCKVSGKAFAGAFEMRRKSWKAYETLHLMDVA